MGRTTRIDTADTAISHGQAATPTSRGVHAVDAAAEPATRAGKPSLDEMKLSGELPLPARDGAIDPRAKAGAMGEATRGPHKPTLDEMGPHAAGGAVPVQGRRPARVVEVAGDGGGEKKVRRGRPRKTGRPGA